jgi:hypothetical protein
VEPPRGPVEAQFLRQLILGESVAPFRMLEPVTAVIPLYHGRVLNSQTARDEGQHHLAAWLAEVEAKWAANANQRADGEPRMTLAAQIDHMRKLSSQFANAGTSRVLYTKAGTRLSAASLRIDDAVVDHKAYWATARSDEEAAYLLAILNSAAALAKITDLQSHGQRDKRDFDNLVWTLPIPEYSETEPLHRDLAVAARRAEMVAALVPLTDTQHFTAKRGAIRAALAEDGVAGEIEALVEALLPS